MSALSRRIVLRGMLGGTAVGVALPLLDCFLDTNGTALAATGAPLPVRFATWFWGLGTTPGRWAPTKAGTDFDIQPEMAPLAPFRDQINILSGFDAPLDGRPNHAHFSGLASLRTGTSPDKPGEAPAPSFDVAIANAIGGASRFRSLEMSATGNAKDSYSWRGTGQVNPAEGSPVTLYTRLFGAEFQDPNSAAFKPDPTIMLRRSVLSPIAEQRERFMKKVGVRDRARLDEYFTSLRQLEQQLAIQLEKPQPLDACTLPGKPDVTPASYEVETVVANHRLMAKLAAMAFACDQTRVINAVYADASSALRKAGAATSHHAYTHEEAVDPQLGYQPVTVWFVLRSMNALADFLGELASVREGTGTLLDNCLVFAHSDTGFARTHSVTALPALTAGKAGGRIRTGIHVPGNGEPVTRLGLTLQQIMGVAVDRWGTQSLETNKPVSQIVV